MAISFALVPENLRVPGRYVEFSNERAVQGLPGIPYRILVMGQRLAAGAVPANQLTRITSVDAAKDAFGEASMLHDMFRVLKGINRFTDTWAIALDDDGGGVAATGTVTFAGAATAAGTVNLYVGGKRVRAAVASGDDAAAVAVKVGTAIGIVAGSLPLTGTINGGIPEQLDFTARHAGESGNDIDLRVNYFEGDALPAGITATVVAMSGGTANPDIASAIAALADEWYQIVAFPYTDAANLTGLETELADRFGPMRAIEGHAIAGARGTHGALTTLGDGRNSPHVTIVGANRSPSSPWEWAAAVSAVVGEHGQRDPARPFQTLSLAGILPPVEADRFTLDERNLALFDGISTFTVDAGGVVRIERLITTYQENPSATPDTSFLDVNTLLTLGFLRWSFRARMGLKFPRHKVADDGTRFGSGQKVITPKIAKAEAIALFREWEDVALVENVEQFKADLIVERNAGDPNRLDFLLPPDLVNQLRIVAAQIEFRL